MNHPIKSEFPPTPVEQSSLLLKDIEEHEKICIKESAYRSPCHEMELVARFRRTFKLGAAAPDNGYGCGETCFLW